MCVNVPKWSTPKLWPTAAYVVTLTAPKGNATLPRVNIVETRYRDNKTIEHRPMATVENLGRRLTGPRLEIVKLLALKQKGFTA